MNETVITVLSMTLSGTVLCLLLFLLKPAIKNMVSKAFLYYMWIPVLLRLTLPIGFGIDVSWALRSPGEAAAMQQAMQSADEGYALQKDEEVFVSQKQTAFSSNGGQTQEQTENSEHSAADTQNIACYIWLAGAALSVLWRTAAYAVFIRGLKRRSFEPGQRELEIFEGINGAGRVRLRYSSGIKTPMLAGILRPVIFLPQQARIDKCGERALENALKHELVHYRRLDVAYKWLASIAVCVHWFNPMVYVMRREMENACELSCDEAVIKDLDCSGREEYGRSLIALAPRRESTAGGTAAFCRGKKQLKKRIVGIMNYKTKTKAALVLMIVLGMLLTGCAAGITAFNETEKGEQDVPSETHNLTVPYTYHYEDGQDKGTPEEQPSAQTQEPAAAPNEPEAASDEPAAESAEPSAASKKEQSSAIEAYMEVLRGNTEFYSVETGKTLNLSEFLADNGTYEVKLDTTRFAVLDMDGDGQDEAVIELSSNGYPEFYEILVYSDGQIYGYIVPYRGLAELKADGTFTASSGASNIMLARMRFTKTAYEMCDIASISLNGDKYEYTADGKSADEKAYTDAYEKQEKKDNAYWLEWTEENMKAFAD